jgi:hypothetical protein
MLGPKQGQFYDTQQVRMIIEMLGWFYVELRVE